MIAVIPAEAGIHRFGSGCAGLGKLTFSGETNRAPFLLSSYIGAIHAHR